MKPVKKICFNPKEKEKIILKNCTENIQELDVESLNTEELKAFVKLMTAKHTIVMKENAGLLQQISLLLEERKQHEELNELQNKEIEQVKNICKEMKKEWISKKTRQKLKKKKSYNFPDSHNLKHDVDDSCQKWHRDEQFFNQNSENCQLLLKKMVVQNKNKINPIIVELKNYCSCLISIEDIRITSSESKYYYIN